MKIFISWSGERSKQVAESLAGWIQCVIQAVEPWISTKDIERGSQWFTEITGQLATISIGIVCITQENKNKPWILFEAGAIAKGLSSSRVCTFLVDLKSTDLENPLAQFNHTTPDKNGLWALVSTVNNSLSEGKLSETVLDRAFKTYGPQFETDFNGIISKTPVTDQPAKREESDIMGEVLNTVRSLDKRLRSIETKPTPIALDEYNFEMDKIVQPLIRRKNLVAEYINELIEAKESGENIISKTAEKFLQPKEYVVQQYTLVMNQRRNSSVNA